MSIYEQMSSFAGKPVVEWKQDTPITDTAGSAYRIALDYEESEEGIEWTDRFSSFLEDPKSAEVEALVIGLWGESMDDGVDDVVETLTVARERLPRLKGLFLGDITSEECEISWIQQGDLSPLFSAFPELEYFGVRGANGLQLGALRLPQLRSLVIESGGLPAEVVRDVAASDLPQLEHLELWLGDSGYGASSTVDDLKPVLSGEKFPKLRYLGLRDSEMADDVAEAVAGSPVLERLETLDLSLGTLGDRGAAALIASSAVAKLRKLIVTHHFISDDMVSKLKALPIEVEADDRQESDSYDGEEHRYVAVGE